MDNPPVVLGYKHNSEEALADTLSRLVAKLGATQYQSQSEEAFKREAKQTLEWIPYPYGITPSQLVELFWLEPTHHACVILKARSLMVDDYYYSKLNNEPGKPPQDMVDYIRAVFPSGLGEVIYPAAVDYEAVGNAYIEVVRKPDARSRNMEGPPVRLVHVPAFSVFRLPPDHPTGCDYVQINGSERVYFRELGKPSPTTLPPEYNQKRVTELVHIKNAGGASASNYWYGLPDILAALTAVQGIRSAMEYQTGFYQARGMPNYFLFLRGAGSAPDAYDVGTVNRAFNEALQRGPGRVVIVPLEQGIEENLKELNMRVDPRDVNLYISECRDQIARVHGVPLRLLSVSQAASLGSATEAQVQLDYFREFIVRPRQVLWETVLYHVLLSSRWPEWKIAFRQLTTEDALRVAQADALSVRTGILSPNEARSRRALEPVPGGDEVVFLSAGGEPLPVRTLERVRDSGLPNRTPERVEQGGGGEA